MKFRKFNQEGRERAIETISYVANEMPLAKPREIARELNRAKLPFADGSKWTGARVGYFMRRNGIKPTKKIEHVAPPKSDDKVCVAELILASKLPDDQKTKILTVIFGGSR